MLQDALRLASGLAISIFAHGALLFFEPGRLDDSRAPAVSLNLVLLPTSSTWPHESQAPEQSKTEAK